MEQTTQPTEGPELYGLRLIRHTGMLVLWHQFSRTYLGKPRQVFMHIYLSQSLDQKLGFGITLSAWKAD